MFENLSYTEMSARLHYSEKHIKYLSAELTNAEAEINELKNELNRVNELLRLAVMKTYASSSERIENCGQLSFFEENEENPVPIKQEVRLYLRAPKRSYKEIYKNLPVEIKEYDISDVEKICDRCQSEMVCIGYDSYREIEYTPAVLKVIEHRRKKYA
ncbi:MAG: hypothetical protein HDT47_01525 [Ruminococcaceae bacterium]|nr:hypothetical protein [Oscillospiraceae bacterium]